ncbi:MAG: tetratricopeptide repeat protein, partial [Methylococcales bacterium]
LIQELLTKSEVYKRFRVAIGQKDFRVSFELIKQHPFLKEFTDYESLMHYADTLYIKSQKLLQSGDTHSAIKVLRVLIDFSDFTQEVKELMRDIESKQKFFNAIEDDDITSAYNLLSMNDELHESEDGKKLQEEWNGDIVEANKLLAQVELEDRDNVEAALITATIEYKTGSKSKAIVAIDKIVAENINLIDGISLLSSIYTLNKQDEKAIQLLTKGAKDNQDNIPLRTALAKLLLKKKDFLGAEKYLKQAIQIEPDTYFLKVALSTFYVNSDQVPKAQVILSEAIKQDPEDPLRYLMLVDLLSSKVSIGKAEEVLEKAIKDRPDLYELKFSKVKFFEKINKRDEAKETLKQIISEKEYDIEGVNARNHLARILLEEKDTVGAKKYADHVLSEYPNNNDALLIISRLAMANNEAVTAINGLRIVVNNSPKNADAAYLLAQAYEINKESNLAENALKKAIEANPINDKTHANYALYLGSKGRVDEALEVVDNALTYFKNSYNLMNIKLKIIANRDNSAEILVLLDAMEQADPSKVEVNITKARYYLLNKDVPKALEQFEKAHKKSIDKFKVLEMIVKVYVANKQPELALKRVEKRFVDNADDAIANQLMGQIYVSQQKFEDAKIKFNSASKSKERWFLPYSMLAAIYIIEKNPDKAIEVYKNAIGKLSNKMPAQMRLASIYERKESYTKALAVYKQVLASNPDNKVVINNYASLLLDHGVNSDLPKALELSKKLKNMPQIPLQDTLGWAYAKSGDNVAAVEILKSVVEKSPKVAVFRYHLGYALYYMGDKSAAKSHLEIASASKQAFPGKEKANELLKSI